MIEHVNNSNANTIKHEKRLPVSICKIITQKITKKNTTCLLKISCDFIHLVDDTK